MRDYSCLLDVLYQSRHSMFEWCLARCPQATRNLCWPWVLAHPSTQSLQVFTVYSSIYVYTYYMCTSASCLEKMHDTPVHIYIYYYIYNIYYIKYIIYIHIYPNDTPLHCPTWLSCRGIRGSDHAAVDVNPALSKRCPVDGFPWLRCWWFPFKNPRMGSDRHVRRLSISPPSSHHLPTISPPKSCV